MIKLLLILAGVTALVLAISLEGWRQKRSLARRGVPVGERPSLIGTGMLELQAMLEPERKVEAVQAELQDRQRLHPEHRPARPSDEDDEGESLAERGDERLD